MASVPSAPQAPELITHSSSTCASTCLRRYFYRYELGLVPSEETEATHRGSLFHLALELRDHGESDEAIAVAAVDVVLRIRYRYLYDDPNTPV